MTMPVLALLSPTAAPQTQIEGQPALPDYSEDQQQSFSEDVAALLEGMEEVLAQLEAEVQQLAGETAAETETQGIVQSMLPQSVLFTSSVAEAGFYTMPVAEAAPEAQTEFYPEILTEFSAEAAVQSPGEINAELIKAQQHKAESELQAGTATQLQRSTQTQLQFSAGAGNQQPVPEQVQLNSQQLAVSGFRSLVQPAVMDSQIQLAVPDAELLAAAEQPRSKEVSSLTSVQQQLVQSLGQSRVVAAQQHNLMQLQQTKHSAIFPVLPDTTAVATVSPLQPAVSSTLPVWQADPLPAQGQHFGQKLIQMLADKVELQLGLNVNKALIRLDPPSLGRIELSVQLEGDRLTVQLNSSNALLREAMGQGLDQLRSSLLQKLGGDVQIELRMSSEQSAQQQQQKGRQQSAQQPDANFYTEPENLAAETSQDNRQNLVNQLV
jgi:flagellar hook-length control protein FliK